MKLDLNMASAYFLSGANMIACAVVAVFFTRFWKRTRDRLFAVFAIAFGLLAVERFVLLFFAPDDESKSFGYTIRLVAFSVLIYGIIDKNRSAQAPPP